MLDVDERCDIRSFVQDNGLIFKPGRGFYEFTKPEKISDKKEVVLVDKVCSVCARGIPMQAWGEVCSVCQGVYPCRPGVRCVVCVSLVPMEV